MLIIKGLIQLVAGVCLAVTIVIGGVVLAKYIGENSFQAYIVAIGVITGCYLAVSYALKGMPKFRKRK